MIGYPILLIWITRRIVLAYLHIKHLFLKSIIQYAHLYKSKSSLANYNPKYLVQTPMQHKGDVIPRRHKLPRKCMESQLTSFISISHIIAGGKIHSVALWLRKCQKSAWRSIPYKYSKYCSFYLEMLPLYSLFHPRRIMQFPAFPLQFIS